MRFEDRVDAAKQLANNIEVTDANNTVVLAMPRGGIPLGITISEKFGIPLDVVLAKKIGHPMNSEFAIGAIAEGGKPLMNEDISVNTNWLENRVKQIIEELDRRRDLYNEVIEKQSLTGKHVIIVDDGIATGRSLYAAIEMVRSKDPQTISVAVPVIPAEAYEVLNNILDRVYYVEIPKRFLGSVSAYYQEFPQLHDYDVQDMLKNFRFNFSPYLWIRVFYLVYKHSNPC